MCSLSATTYMLSADTQGHLTGPTCGSESIRKLYILQLYKEDVAPTILILPMPFPRLFPFTRYVMSV